MTHNQTEKIREHYDLVSPFYQKLWGKHIHHGYYKTGKESKKVATDNLVKLLIKRSGLAKKAIVLDIGCGVGGTSIQLAKNLNCKVTGITISPVQVQMAKEASRNLKNKPHFLVDDANDLSLEGKFDAVWAVETISHLNNRKNFFKKVTKLLVPGGKICVAAWLKDDNVTKESEKKYIKPIEEGMLVSLPNLSEYKKHIDDNGLRLLYYEDISSRVNKTWDVCLDIIKNRALWRLASQHSKEFMSFLKSFRAMRVGFKTSTLRYSVMVIEKPLLQNRL